MAKIFIKELKIETIIGVLPEERVKKQLLLISLQWTTAIQQAAKTDNLKDTVDYLKIAQRITDFTSKSHFQLLEALADKLVELIFAEFNIASLRLEIIKPSAIPNAKHAGIILERSR